MKRPENIRPSDTTRSVRIDEETYFFLSMHKSETGASITKTVALAVRKFLGCRIDKKPKGDQG